MNNFLKKSRAKTLLLFSVFALFLQTQIFAQNKSVEKKTDLPKAETKASTAVKVTQIDDAKLKELVKPNGKPLLVNFWATWCDPCREEFPDLVKLENDYRGKVDVITVSLDDITEINTGVPKFLSEMKAEMPTYLLVSKDEGAIISTISKDWSGGLPFTILYDEKGETIYFKQGKFKVPELREKIDQTQTSKPTDETVALMDFVKIKDGKRDEALFFYNNNWKLYREAALKKGIIHSYELIEAKSESNSSFDLILITRYKNEDQYKNSEKNFEPILKEIRPNGALLKNELKPEDFRQNVFLSVGKPVFASNN